jgi:hypothetical protein
MKIGYKGFNKHLVCREQKFEIGATYYKVEANHKPKLCSNDGYHYCNTLGKVFNYYRNEGGNRFCEIEILGNITEDNEKSITTYFRIIRELYKEEINKILEKEKSNELKKDFNIEYLKEFQTKYPMTHIGGSTALFIHGVNLKRWKTSFTSDWDTIAPYFILFEDGVKIQYTQTKKSGNDFDETFFINSPNNTIKMDVRIDPKARYEIVEFDGFKFKVAPLLTIIEAKIRYAMQGDLKHEADLREMLLRNHTIN